MSPSKRTLRYAMGEHTTMGRIPVVVSEPDSRGMWALDLARYRLVPKQINDQHALAPHAVVK